MENYRNFSHLNLAEETGDYRKTKSGKRKKKSGFWQVLLKYVLPFIVINLIIFVIVTSQPKFTMVVEDNGDNTTATLTVNIQSIYPRKEFTVIHNGNEVAMEEVDKRTYVGTLEGNGTLQVSLTNLNGMNKTEVEAVNFMDDEPPVITEDDAAEGYVSIYVEDAQSGVDFDSIYAVDGNGKQLKPTSIYKDESIVYFEFETAPLEIHVFDNSGRETIATFSINDGSEENSDQIKIGG